MEYKNFIIKQEKNLVIIKDSRNGREIVINNDKGFLNDDKLKNIVDLKVSK